MSGVPRLARALLERVLPPHRRDDVIGDLAEVHSRRVARSRVLASLLTCTDALLVASAFLLHRSGVRSPFHAPPPARLGSELLADVRFALRHLTRRPGFSALALGTLALGIGSTFALYIVVHALMVRPLPYAVEERTVVLWQPGEWRAGELDVARRAGLPSLRTIGGYTTSSSSLRSGEGSTVVRSALLFPGTLDVLGVSPLLGRAFDERDHAPGAGEVVLLGRALWRTVLGADTSLVGRTIELDGRAATVVGVMPEPFFFPDPDVRIWKPLVVDPTSAAYAGRSWLTAIARLDADLGEEQVERDLTRLAGELEARFEYPGGSPRDRSPITTPIRNQLLGDTSDVLLLLLASVGLLLAAAVANVAVLVSARTHDRRAELSLRRSLGAGTGRVLRQLLTEGAVLGGLAGVLAAGLGASVYRGVVSFLPLGPGFEQLPALGSGLIAAVVGASAVVGVLTTLLPTALLLRGGSRLALDIRASTADGRVHRVQAALVAAQVAAALTLVSGATLMARSVEGLLDVELGLRRSDVVVASVSLAPRAQADRRTSYAEMVERVSRLPGVASVGLISQLPLRDLGWAGPVMVEGRPQASASDASFAYHRVVTPGALDALGIQLLRGRGFSAADDASADPVVLINRSFADTLWAGEDPIGRRIASVGFEGDVWATVVGVVEDVRVDGPTWGAGSMFYRPLAQAAAPAELALVMRTTAAEGASVVGPLRAEVAAVDPMAAVHRISTMDDVLRQAIGQPLRLRFFLTLLAGLALAVGSAGVFGMVSYAVGRRTREYGIRMVLGADGQSLVRAEVRRAARTVVLGGVLGVIASLVSARALGSFLFGVGPTDPWSLAAALALLLLAGVGAAIVPAARAGRVDPLRSLRAE